jgi:hypothetical protein
MQTSPWGLFTTSGKEAKENSKDKIRNSALGCVFTPEY